MQQASLDVPGLNDQTASSSRLVDIIHFLTENSHQVQQKDSNAHSPLPDLIPVTEIVTK
jgi:hypothetical protein